jgi:hypothetical protein
MAPFAEAKGAICKIISDLQLYRTCAGLTRARYFQRAMSKRAVGLSSGSVVPGTVVVLVQDGLLSSPAPLVSSA